MDLLRPQREAQHAERRVAEGLSARGLVAEEVPDEIRRHLRQRALSGEQRLFVGRYLVAQELGRGGMGVVYEAWDAEIARRVAVKTLEPELVPDEDRAEVIQRFRRETRVVGRLKHPSIVTIFDSGIEHTADPLAGQSRVALLYYVMEYLEGCSLARRLAEEGSLPERAAIQVAADIADALQLIHNAGVIHRDIKPANVFLKDSGLAVLLAFGIAKAGDLPLTRQGHILGTPSYLAPERLRESDAEIDGRADIFSLGVLLFTMLTGEAPFVGDDVYEVIDKITKETHPRLYSSSRAGPLLVSLIDRMLAKRPDERFESASAVVLALHHVRTVLDDPVTPRVMEADERDRAKTAPLPLPSASRPGALFAADEAASLDADSTTVREEFEVEIDLDADLFGDEVEHRTPVPFVFREEETRPVRPPLAGDPRPGSGPAASVLDETECPTPVPMIEETTEHETVMNLGPRDRRSPTPPPSNAEVNGISPPERPAASEPAFGTQAARAGRDVRNARIEASLVDEDDVIVRPATLSALKPDELPTQKQYPVDGDLGEPSVEGLEDGVRVLDPAEFVGPSRSRGLGSLDIFGIGRRKSTERTGGPPEHEKSAAVARRTFGTEKPPRAPGRRPVSPLVRVRGDLSDTFDRSKGARRTVFLVLCAAMASVAVGVFIGRNRAAPRTVLAPVAHGALNATPTAESQLALRTDRTSIEPRLLRPRLAREILADAQAARLGGDFQEAARLFDNAMRAAADGGETRARATLGRADLLRQLGRPREAIGLYRVVANTSPHSREGRQARVALEELGLITRRRTRPAASNETSTGPKAARTPTDKCRAITRTTFGRPREAIRRFGALAKEHPDAACIFFSLGLRHEEINDARSALVAYRKFVELAPTSPRRRAVDARIKTLEGKVRLH